MRKKNAFLPGYGRLDHCTSGTMRGALDNWVKLQREYDCYFLRRRPGLGLRRQPDALAGCVPRLVGVDGNAKMSKSRGNTIDLTDSAETVAKKVRRMYGGPPRDANEPGRVEENPIFLYLDAFDPDTAQVRDLKERYERAGVSNRELKDRLTSVLYELLEPVRERGANYESNMSRVREALDQGTKRGRAIAREAMEMVRDALDLNYLRKY